MCNRTPAAFQKPGKRQESLQTTWSQDWGGSADPQAQAVAPPRHEAGPAETNQALGAEFAPDAWLVF